ncbi:phosphopantetheine adenylyltransferase [Rhodoferax sp. AJA081-3]|uniref:phosphopantetheine adenylyltransferase n=1 Tax=Rhodoferax sp. AJA081-3 TaxID=2752316 RepID=UPI001FD7B7A9|nr:phosphopantetheine adenylyltransferase [Rhodoferax sp. AJA081-3]
MTHTGKSPAMHYLTMAMLMVVGIIHLLPMSGVLGTERLAALYGLPINEPNLAILMRHRAVLFGLLGLFLVYAAFRPGLQTLAFVAGFASVLSFLWLAWSQGGYNPQIQRVVIADVVALVCLVLGGLVHAYRQLRN